MKKYIYERWIEHVYLFVLLPIALYGMFMSFYERDITIENLVKCAILGILGYIVFICIGILLRGWNTLPRGPLLSDEEL